MSDGRLAARIVEKTGVAESTVRARFTLETFPYLQVLLILYAVYYGAMLLFARGLPYVMDGNESFSVFWHAYNLLHFDITKSFGLTDEAYGFSAAAHPYLHTHQGNMPRLFGALIYALGARSVEAQIVVTTATIGTATVVFAFRAMRRLSNPLFAFVFCALLITDYLQFAQWNVVTYRVWYGFLFFAVLLSIMRAGEPAGRWALPALFGSFTLLFYNELVFAGLMAIIAWLFTVYWHRRHAPLVIKLWIVQIAGAATALAVLATQLLLKFGPEVVKRDFATTFLMRNLSNDLAQQEAAIDFSNDNGIVFWLNFVDSSNLRNLVHFVRVQAIHVFQLYTPWLMLLAVIILGGFVLSVVFDKRFGADFTKWKKDFPLAAFFAKGRSRLLAAALLVLAMAVPAGTRFRSIDVALGLAAGIAAAYLLSAAVARWDWVGWRNRIATLRNQDVVIVIESLAFATAAFLFFARPVSFPFGSRMALAVSTCVICLLHRGTSWQLAPTARRWGLKLSERTAPYVERAFKQWKVWLPAAFGMVLLLLLLRVGTDMAVFGLRPQPGPDTFSLRRVALAFLVALIVTRSLSAVWNESAKLRALTVCVLIGFCATVALFINNQWRLYDQDFSILWTMPFRFPGVALGERLLVLASVFLGASLILVGWRRLIPVHKAVALVDPLALLVIGEVALLVIFYLSPGYVLTGYLQRTAPFTVFFTSLPVAMMFYLVAVVTTCTYPVVRRVHRVKAPAVKRRLASCFRAPRFAVAVVASGLLIALTLYWAALQGNYARMLPANYFAMLKELRNPPFAGKSAVVNTYAAPVAAMTGKWAYFDGTYFLNLLHRDDSGYAVDKDMRNYLWLADRYTNPEYGRPDYFICLWPQNLYVLLAERGKGFARMNHVCPEMPIVAAAAHSTGLLHHKLVAADVSPRGSWAIVKLDHELPPLAEGVTAMLVREEAGFAAKASYHYFQQDGTPEGDTVIELVGERRAQNCALAEKAEVLASANAGKSLPVPRNFSGTIALRVTPVSTRKAGKPVMSNRFVVEGHARQATACPVEFALDFRDFNIWQQHAVTGLNPAGSNGSLFTDNRARVLIDVPRLSHGAVDLGIALTRTAVDRDLDLIYEVNGEIYGPFHIDTTHASVEHILQVPVSVIRRRLSVSLSMSTTNNRFGGQQLALQRLTVRNRP